MQCAHVASEWHEQGLEIAACSLLLDLSFFLYFLPSVITVCFAVVHSSATSMEWCTQSLGMIHALSTDIVSQRDAALEKAMRGVNVENDAVRGPCVHVATA